MQYGSLLVGKEVQSEIDTGEKHEKDGHALDQWRVEVAYGSVVGRKPADRHGREAVADRIETAHAGEPVGQRADGGESKIDGPERQRRFLDPRCEF